MILMLNYILTTMFLIFACLNTFTPFTTIFVDKVVSIYITIVYISMICFFTKLVVETF